MNSLYLFTHLGFMLSYSIDGNLKVMQRTFCSRCCSVVAFIMEITSFASLYGVFLTDMK